MAHLERVPEAGARFEWEGFYFEVVARAPRSASADEELQG